MAKIIRIEEHFQHFLNEVKESFWGDLYGQTFSSVLPWNENPHPQAIYTSRVTSPPVSYCATGRRTSLSAFAALSTSLEQRDCPEEPA